MIGSVDLSPAHCAIVQRILKEHVQECEVRAFGSRVAWTAKDFSDLDLAVVDEGPLPWQVLSRLKEAFEESPLPMRIDVLDWHAISESFRKVIERDYVVVQDRVEEATAGEWREVTLGDLINIKHGFAFKGSFFRDEPQGDVLLTPGNFAIGGGFKEGKLKYYDGVIPEEFVLQEGDLLVTMTDLSKQSDTLGYPAFVPADTDGRSFLHNQRLGKVVSKNYRDIYLRYIYYVMCSDEYRAEVLASATGTTVKHTSPGRIKQFRFSLPPLPEQHAIAHVLGTLDDKIELNRRMNETLEEMARGLFKSWFVDFDPVRAKAALKHHAVGNHAARDGKPSGNGAAPAGEWTVERARAYLAAMDPQIADLFPDRLVDSELGEIPEGWAVLPAGQAVTVHGGSTPSTKEPSYWGGEHCFATPKDLSTLQEPILASTARRLTDAGIGRIGSRLLPPGTVLLSSRAPIGYLAVTETATAVNQGIIAMVCDGPVGAFYALQWTRCHMYAIEDRASGTTFAEISKSSFREIPFLVPSESTHAAWKSVAASLYGLLALNQRQSRALGAQRDALLPKLISGETQMKLSA